jgi:uncharacterized membrane protein
MGTHPSNGHRNLSPTGCEYTIGRRFPAARSSNLDAALIGEVRMNTRYLVASALAVAIVAPVALSAQKPVPAPTAFKTEKCYGISKAGKNDCASTGNNSCGGSSKLNSDPKAWIYVPAGYCDRIVGGSLQPK